MSKLSVSLTLGKASAGNVNLDHNHRDTIAGNVDISRTKLNITYVHQDVEEAYEKLFSSAIDEYNLKQKQPCRRIANYYEHVANSKRVEPYYELIVQFGDMRTAPVDSENGKLATKMLDEYVRSFKQRNPNLHIVCSVTHLDEASPHAHISFIPFYTQGRKNGLSKGVSMKAALIEQGFVPNSANKNQLILWQDNERKVMENILHKHGYEREVKNATHQHKSVSEYKESQDVKKLLAFARQSQQLDTSIEEVARLQRENSLLYTEKEKLLAEKQSPWKSFFFSDKAKLDFVLVEIRQRNIPIRETESGFEAQEIFVEEIRRIEKAYKPVTTSYRETLRDELDKVTMMSSSFDEVLEKLRQLDYEVKLGKYVAVKPKYGEKFIRLKSLGEEYSEQSIRNRLVHKARFESEVDKQISVTKSDTFEFMLHKTVRQYTIVFAHGVLPVRKRNKKKPFEWTNCDEIDKLAELNRKINSGLTLSSLRNSVAYLEENSAEEQLKIAVELLELAEKVMAGNHVQNLINAEKLIQQAEYYVPNGLRNADSSQNDDEKITQTIVQMRKK